MFFCRPNQTTTTAFMPMTSSKAQIGSSRLCVLFRPFNLNVNFYKYKKRQLFPHPTFHSSLHLIDKLLRYLRTVKVPRPFNALHHGAGPTLHSIPSKRHVFDKQVRNTFAEFLFIYSLIPFSSLLKPLYLYSIILPLFIL